MADASGLAKDTALKPFVDALRGSRLYSIDAFLGIRTEFADIGKRAIAAVLLDHEHRSNVRSDDVKSDWYDYLWNRVASGQGKDEMTFGWLKVVTFNYDRTLETFLLRAAMHTYGLSEVDAENMVQALQIEHVYGRLGSPWRSSADYVEFGPVVTSEIVAKAAESLIVIPEARDDEPSFLRARQMLSAADAVCFLGFGFDDLNLRRLDSHNTCTSMIMRPDRGQFQRRVAASCKGSTIAQIERRMMKCQATDKGAFLNGDCQATLDHTLILEY